jgi:flagellar hook-associated protein FlgK
MVLNTAKGAIAAQQAGLNVAGHNIANVNTPSYSRQSVPHTSKRAIQYGGHIFGTGVDIQTVRRSSDQFLEDRLIHEKSNLTAYQEANAFMGVMESLFNENAERSLSTLMSEFWNSWQDLSNAPAAAPERSAVYEKGVQVAEQFEFLNAGLTQLRIDLTIQLDSAMPEVNSITREIASINNEIVGMEHGRTLNDLRDKRNALVTELAQLLDLHSFEQPDGALTVTTANGFVLVNGTDTYQLSLVAGRVRWEGSGSSQVDISDRLQGGKIGGWLQMRDDILPKYEAEINELAREFTWAVNSQHSQGVGLEYYDQSVTGEYATDSSGILASLPFGNRIDYTQDFSMWVENTSTLPPQYNQVRVDLDLSDATVGSFSGNGTGTGPYKYRFTVASGGTVGSTGTDPVLNWEKIDLNNVVVGNGTTTVTDVDTLSAPVDGGLTFNIAAGQMVAGNTFTINTDTSVSADPFTFNVSAAKANSVLDTYTFKVRSSAGNGQIGTDTIELEWSNSVTSGTLTIDGGVPYPVIKEVDGMQLSFDASSGTLLTGDVFTIDTDDTGTATVNSPSAWHWTLQSFTGQFNQEAITQGVGLQATVAADHRLTFIPATAYDRFAFGSTAAGDSGLAAALGFNTFFSGDDAETIEVNRLLAENKYIAAAQINTTTGLIASGDNRNAIAMADIQHLSLDASQWTVSRGQSSYASCYRASLEGYYQRTVGSLGIQSLSYKRGEEFGEVMVQRMGEERDNISGVSLDEEMINIMTYQHAYTVASKLLSVADEMLQTLISFR